jgi:hypothetical protein
MGFVEKMVPSENGTSSTHAVPIAMATDSDISMAPPMGTAEGQDANTFSGATSAEKILDPILNKTL